MLCFCGTQWQGLHHPSPHWSHIFSLHVSFCTLSKFTYGVPCAGKKSALVHRQGILACKAPWARMLCHLHLVTTTTSIYIRESRDFVTKCNQMLDEDTMVSLDVVNIFTRVPVSEALQGIEDKPANDDTLKIGHPYCQLTSFPYKTGPHHHLLPVWRWLLQASWRCGHGLPSVTSCGQNYTQDFEQGHWQQPHWSHCCC